MRFAVAWPWWTLVLLFAGAILMAWGAYARPLVPLPLTRRLTLSTLRAAALVLALVCLLRPVRLLPPGADSDAVVAILVDVSRSMALPDGSGVTRLAAARDIVDRRLVPQLAAHGRAEIWTFGDRLAPVAEQSLVASAGQSDLAGAVREIRERYRDRRLAGIVVVSDGGDTGGRGATGGADVSGVPVFTVGVGETSMAADLEATGLSAGEASLGDSAIDLVASAVGHGAGAFDMRVLENGRPVDVRRVTPSAPGSPVQATFTVSPPGGAATLYTLEIPPLAGEAVPGNNRRTVLVEAPRRARRVLIVEGAPGFEHSFMKRALMADSGLEIDSVVRKGRDAQGRATFFVQAPAERAAGLMTGFPVDRETLFAYDAVVLANIENDLVPAAQLALVPAFVAERGGGLLVLGAKSFGARGMARTALDDVLPVGLDDRGDGVVQASAGATERHRVAVSRDGEAHPVMRIGEAGSDTQRRWQSLPPLAGAALLGGLRPAAQVLATVATTSGERPLVAVQRYGEGRSMVFTGEASWRWRMQMPVADRTFELFWRQAVRWLATGASDPVNIVVPPGVSVGAAAPLAAVVRDAAFAPVTNARLSMTITLPDGKERGLRPGLVDPATGRYAADFTFERQGVYRVTAEARQGDRLLGTAERWILAGGVDAELSDPRLNDGVLRRLSRETGGQYLPAADAARLPALLAPPQGVPAAPLMQDLWHNGGFFTAIVMLLAAEWILRRQWGLR